MNLPHFPRPRHPLRALQALSLALSLALPPAAAAAGVVAEGVWTVREPEAQTIPFRMVVTDSGARITPAGGETIVLSYADRSALVIDERARSYLPVPLDLVSPLLAQGFGYDPTTLGAAATGRSRRLLGVDCGEVVVSGRSPKLTLTSCRAKDPALSREYAAFERALSLPWAAGTPPAVITGIPLTGSVRIEGRRPYDASWEITRLRRDEKAREDFAVPPGYAINLDRLLSVQGGRR